MGIEEKGQICVMIHSGSRGFGHQVATGFFQSVSNYINCLYIFCFILYKILDI